MDYTKYENKVKYPDSLVKPWLKQEDRHNVARIEEYAKEVRAYEAALPEYRKAKDIYRKEGGRLHELFKHDALEEVGLLNHPKADKIFDYAWEHGHASGYHDVWCYLSELTELFSN